MHEDSTENPPLRRNRHRPVIYLLLIAAAAAGLYFLLRTPDPVYYTDFRHPSPEVATVEQPQEKLPTATYEIQRADGKKIPFELELATTVKQQEKGMMFRQIMDANQGMLFLYSEAADRQIWMKNTVIPLDILFIGDDDRIVHIAADAVPLSEEIIPTPIPSKAILELRGGVAKAYKLTIGDKLTPVVTPTPEHTHE